MSNLHSPSSAFKTLPVVAGGNVITFPPLARRTAPSAFDGLTTALLLAKHDRGELPRGVLVALLAGVGLEP